MHMIAVLWVLRESTSEKHGEYKWANRVALAVLCNLEKYLAPSHYKGRSWIPKECQVKMIPVNAW